MSIIKNNQSAFDIATQLTGDAKSVLDMCISNNFSLTSDLEPSTEVLAFETEHINDDVLEEYFAKDKELTTGEPKISALIDVIGIGSMGIGNDFDIL